MGFKRSIFLAPLLLLLFSNGAIEQQSRSYFAFWTDGEWVSELTLFEGDTITEQDRFEVRKLKDINGFIEAWKIYIGEGEYVEATAIRAYDGESGKWKLFYVDDRNVQTWDSEVLRGKVYFFKTFKYEGREFYSRQSWSLRQDGKVLRTIERSADNKVWTSRYWQLFKKQN